MRPGRLLRAVRWYLRELTGEAEYDRYCDLPLTGHPQACPPTRREYQRLRAARQEGVPRAGCC